MTDIAPTEPAQAVFVQPPEYATEMQMAPAVRSLLRSDQGAMPDKVADALMAVGGAGDIMVPENQIEALYDWACLGDCPDDARRVAYGAASLWSRYSFGIMGKATSPDQPKRADAIRAELRRQMGDPAASVTEAERPAPKGAYVPPPAQPVVKATVEDIAALVRKIAAVKDGLNSGALTPAQAAKQLDEAHADAEAMAPLADTPAQAAAA